VADYSRDVEKIKNPENIRDALAASSSYVLLKAFDNDETVRRLIRGGREVAPLISREIEQNAPQLDEITLACFAYILQKTDADAAVRVLAPLFAQSIAEPRVLFTDVAAHGLRQIAGLPTRLNASYSKAEWQDTADRF
jgi:hypothetical protein